MRKISLSKIPERIVEKRKRIELIFLVCTILCAACFPFVGVNYNLSEYLPDFAPTKQALDVMEAEFGYPGMARIMVKGVTLPEAKQIRDKIAALDSVDLAVGVDTFSSAYSGYEFMSNELNEKFYKDGNAVIEVIFKDGDSDESTKKALDEIYNIVGEDRGAFSGSAVSSKFREESISKEILMATLLSIVIILAILLLTTTSWVEPFLFIGVMLVAIILNMGSNLMFHRISFFTFSTAAILQLAVSMDYSIFLLHSFMANKEKGMDPEQAMVKAIQSRSILASGAATIIGFLAITLMQFKVGKDVGLVLSKGILFSLLTVLLLMPALILRYDEKITKYRHKSFLPSFDKLGLAMRKIRWPILVLCLGLAVPCFIGQGLNKFYYGDDALGASPGTTYYDDTQEINQTMGKSNMIMAIVPNTSYPRERELTQALEDLDFVNYAISFAGTVPQGVPEEFLPQDLMKQLHTENYARIMISMNNSEESDYSFACSDQLESVVKEYYPDGSYVIGMTPTTMDIRDILTRDHNIVSIISLIGVAIVVVFTFKSLLVPIFVIIPIEVAIYLNMTIPYVMGHSIIFIGFIIVSCLQLGATIDYSILVTHNYLEEREHHDSKTAAVRTVSHSAWAVLTSGSILTVVGYLLYFTSSIIAIQQVGHLVARGALLSMLLVLSLLPALLDAFDGPIQRQQKKAIERSERHRKKLLALRAGSAALLPKASTVPADLAPDIIEPEDTVLLEESQLEGENQYVSF